jgi:hypothetical protein
MKGMSIILCLLLVATPCRAVTDEAMTPNLWQEFDITFWQTLPFATLFGYFIDRQLSSYMFPGSEVHWQAVMTFSVIISAGNAFLHTNQKLGVDK